MVAPSLRSSPTLPTRRWSAWLVFLVLAPLIAGCRGCSSSDPLSEEEREAKREELKKKEKPKPDFQFLRFTTQPGELQQADRQEVNIKPGHWTSAVLAARANNFDFRGELLTEMQDQSSRPVPLDDMLFQLRTARPVILPKGQQRLLEFSVLAPAGHRAKNLPTRLLTGTGGRPVFAETQVVSPMPPSQFYFIVLALNPDSYSFLKKLESVTAPNEHLFDINLARHYHVIAPQIKSTVPLPSYALSWTGIAYLLWDDLEPKKLTPEQQQALLDWLHWGGQLIVSGPDTLATLKGSFLDEYLPAHGDATWQIGSETLQPLDAGWTKGDRPLKVVRPWTGVHLKTAEGAQVLLASGDEPLVVERSLGRGRIVLTAFRLSQRELRNWPSFDGFLNGCLMRRPPRTFRFENELIQVGWQDAHDSHDPRRVTRVRYFTRDAQAPISMFTQFMRTAEPAPPPQSDIPGNMAYAFQMQNQPPVDLPPYGPGVAGWTDFSAASNLALATLREAAGIVVPDASFVVWVLAIYVVVLVPVNWLFFRLLGRVEWAWAAAPFISIGGAIAVVYLAQLDIGFARSKTELSVVEVQARYPRAHVTRYLALYSSLGTQYDLRFDDQSAVALPFAAGQKTVIGQSMKTVDYRRAPQIANDEVAQVTLDGLEISSNTTGMVHSEEMIDVGGGFGWQPLGGNRYRVINDTRLSLEGAGVLGQGKIGWIGKLAPGADAVVELVERPEKETEPWAGQLEESPITSLRGSADGLNLRHMLLLAQNEIGEERGWDEMRLVAWTDEELPGLTVRPVASQSRRAALVVGHLSYGPEPAPVADTNSSLLAYQAAGKLPPPEDEEE